MKENKNKKCSMFFIASILLIVLEAFLASFHMYNDLLISAKQGLHIWEILLSGKLFDFYNQSTMASGNAVYSAAQDAVYPISIYIVYGIWELPIFILEKILQRNVYNTVFGTIYTKMILMVFTVLTAKTIKDIIFDLSGNDEESEKYFYLFVSSLLIFTEICVAGGQEIIGLFFTLSGIRYWLKNNEKVFLIFFAIAVTFKYFPIMYFVPLLLITNKKPSDIMLKTGATILPCILLESIFKKPIGGGDSHIFSVFLDRIAGNTVSIGDLEISVFILLSIVVCYLAYIQKFDESKERITYMVYPIIVMTAFSVITRIYPYWSVLSIPAFIFTIYLSKNKVVAYICEIVLSVGLAIKHLSDFYFVYGMETVNSVGLINLIFNIKPDYDLNYGIGNQIGYYLDGISFLRYFLDSFLIGIWIVMLLNSLNINDNGYKTEPKAERFLIIMRTVINIMMGIMPITYLILSIL